jgi:hypothetical protein
MAVFARAKLVLDCLFEYGSTTAVLRFPFSLVFGTHATVAKQFDGPNGVATYSFIRRVGLCRPNHPSTITIAYKQSQ